MLCNEMCQLVKQSITKQNRHAKHKGVPPQIKVKKNELSLL